jgi:hypothetical protein
MKGMRNIDPHQHGFVTTSLQLFYLCNPRNCEMIITENTYADQCVLYGRY